MQGVLLQQVVAHPSGRHTKSLMLFAWPLQDDFQGDMSGAWTSQTRPLGQSMLQQLRQDSLAATVLFNDKVSDSQWSLVVSWRQHYPR